MTARKRGRPKKKKASAAEGTPSTYNKDEGTPSSINKDADLIDSSSTSKKGNPISRSTVKEKGLGDLAVEEASKRSNAEVVGPSENLELNLKYVETEEINGITMARMLKEDLLESSYSWDKTILCCVLGANPPLKIMDGFLRRIKIEEISVLREGQFVVHFDREEHREEVTKRKLPDLDLKFWSLNGLSKIGSIIGKPIRRDKATATMSKLGYARIQLEVAIQNNFPDKCHKLGHSGEACRNKQGKEAGSKSKTMVWRPKKNTEDRDKEIAQPTEREAGILKEYSIIQKATPRYEEEFQTVDKKKSAKRGLNKKARSFRFCDMWVLDQDFSKIVQKVWDKDMAGRFMFQDIGFSSMFRTYPSLVSQFSFSFEANGYLPIDGYKLLIARWEVDFQTRKESALNDLQRSCLPIDGLSLPSLGSHRWDRFPIAGQGCSALC
ncbi:hypothetical protein DM860_002811 [Cuscuta australis]|uniref:DUF4283 domain-containing protein n=1 Tax=Cuscuta australis TaxID=267555 RepID=A0A328D433_9ASTE|nr:hypothetical protein DM860_002811 [Cuscuta australis]